MKECSKTERSINKKDILPTEKESRHEWRRKRKEEEHKVHKEIENFGYDELNTTDTYDENDLQG